MQSLSNRIDKSYGNNNLPQTEHGGVPTAFLLKLGINLKNRLTVKRI